MTSDVMLVERFGNYQLGRGLSTATVRRRKAALRSLGEFLGSQGCGFATASTADIEEWLGTKPTATTRHAYRSDLRAFFSWAVRRKLLDENPAADVDSVRVPKRLPRPIDDDDVMRVLRRGEQSDRRMVALGLLAGLRRSEIAVLDGRDLSLRANPPLLVVRNGKGGKDRIVPVHPELAKLLRGVPRSGPVFPGEFGGGTMSPDAIGRRIRFHLLRCGIDATAHQLRHSFGTEMAKAANGNLLAVATVMGHESIQTTRQYVGWDGGAAPIVAAMFGSDRGH